MPLTPEQKQWLDRYQNRPTETVDSSELIPLPLLEKTLNRLSSAPGGGTVIITNLWSTLYKRNEQFISRDQAVLPKEVELAISGSNKVRDFKDKLTELGYNYLHHIGAARFNILKEALRQLRS